MRSPSGWIYVEKRCPDMETGAVGAWGGMSQRLRSEQSDGRKSREYGVQEAKWKTNFKRRKSFHWVRCCWQLRTMRDEHCLWDLATWRLLVALIRAVLVASWSGGGKDSKSGRGTKRELEEWNLVMGWEDKSLKMFGRPGKERNRW